MKRLRDEWNEYLDSYGRLLWVVLALIVLAGGGLFLGLVENACPTPALFLITA